VTAIAAGDFDGDGTSDLVVFTATSLRLLAGADAGLLTPMLPSPMPEAVQAMAADFDGDQRIDVIAVGSDGAVRFYRGRGDGSFEMPHVVRTLARPERLAAADVDGDGHPDLVALSDGAVEVWRNDGAAGFPGAGDTQTSGALFTAGPSAARDLDGDGGVDLAFGSAAPSSSLTVARGAGAGTFATDGVTVPIPTATVSALAACDLDGDGAPDLALAASDRAPSVLRNAGNLTFTELALAGGATATDLTVGDFDGDGRPDLATARDVYLSIYLGRGQ